MIPEEPGLVDTAARSRRAALGAAALLAVVAVLAAVDLASDAREGVAIGHAVLEGAIVLCGAAGTAVLVAQAFVRASGLCEEVEGFVLVMAHLGVGMAED